MLVACAGAFAMTFKEAYDEIAKLPPLEGVDRGTMTDVLGGWIDAMPIDNAQCSYATHEVGSGQTVYYGSAVEKVAKLLPPDEKILYGADFQNIFYMYAKPVDKHTYEMLILVDQAYQGVTAAIYGHVNAQVVKALREGKVKFTYDHKIVVNVPLMVFD